MDSPPISSVKRRRRRERIGVIGVLFLVLFFGLLEGWFFRFKSGLPLLGNIFLFALINVNVSLLLLLTYLVLRNIVKLVFERKRNILGHQLRTRLVIAFVGLTLIPTLPLFLLATQFVSFSLDYWFNHEVEQSLKQAVSLAKDYLEQEKEELASDCRLLQSLLSNSVQKHGSVHIRPPFITDSLLAQFHLNALFFLGEDGKVVWQHRRIQLTQRDVEGLRALSIKQNAPAPDIHYITLENQQEGLAAQILFPFSGGSLSGRKTRLVLLRLLSSHIMRKTKAITAGYENYLQLKLLKTPMKTSHFITFSIVTLLVIFAAIWFGFHLARNITVPVQNLVAATQRVAEGDLDVRLEWDHPDEIGMLIASFNRMVSDLQQSRAQLANAYEALKQGHQELEDRRRYMEIVLKNVAAGVVSVNAEGTIMTINKSAESMFGIQAEQALGHTYVEVLQPSYLQLVESFMDIYDQSRQSHLERQVQVIVNNRPMVLLIKATILKDEQEQYVGVVVVFDDLTDLEKAQRMAAWREVARRIAHEIKNPLTPIQLSAQRLRRKYSDLLSDAEDSLLEECTRTIIQQVDTMKHLVNEFSTFARLPRARPALCDLASIVEESLALYRHSHHNISFSLKKDEYFPLLNLDKDQFKQVMINLLDNAIHAFNGEKGAILVTLSYDEDLKIARLECADTGYGLPPEDKLRIFEPYYSTKEKGSGLGLAIVASIVADHSGFVRVRDNNPRGTIMTIELPG